MTTRNWFGVTFAVTIGTLAFGPVGAIVALLFILVAMILAALDSARDDTLS